MEWGHHPCFLAAETVYRAQLKKTSKSPLAESQPHHTVDKLMGELANGMINCKVELRKTTRELARYKLQGNDAPLDPLSRYPNLERRGCLVFFCK